MKLPSSHAVGAATHTGKVRLVNEDDYLLGAFTPPTGNLLLLAVADGMGGVAGGAEASRMALRALGSAVLDAASGLAIEARLQAGFQAAATRLHEHATAVPALREMGTTLTALCLTPGEGRLGHVGDTRLYRLFGGELELLTEDHAVRQPDNVLTRCIGGGRADCEPDVATFRTRVGERYLLLTDGVWSLLTAADLVRVCVRDTPQAAAEALVRAALRCGGPDNATALVVDVLAVAPAATAVDALLPRDERPDPRADWPRAVALRRPVWPWFVLCAALAVAGAAALREWGGIDVLQSFSGGG